MKTYPLHNQLYHISSSMYTMKQEVREYFELTGIDYKKIKDIRTQKWDLTLNVNVLVAAEPGGIFNAKIRKKWKKIHRRGDLYFKVILHLVRYRTWKYMIPSPELNEIIILHVPSTFVAKKKLLLFYS